MKDTKEQTPAFAGVRLCSTDEVEKLLGYTDRASFWSAVHSTGLPYIRINKRRVVFRESDVIAWIEARTVGQRPETAA